MFTGAAAVYISTRLFVLWEDLRTAIETEFHHQHRPSVIYQRLRDHRRKPEINVHQYILEMEKIAALGPTDVEELIQCIIHGLNDSLAITLFAHVKSVRDIKDLAPRYEEMLVVERKKRANRINHASNNNRANKNARFNCQQPGHQIANCPLNQQVAAVGYENQHIADPSPIDWNEMIAHEEEDVAPVRFA